MSNVERAIKHPHEEVISFLQTNPSLTVAELSGQRVKNSPVHERDLVMCAQKLFWVALVGHNL